MSVLVNIRTVNSSAGTGDSAIDTAAYAEAVSRITSAGGGVIAFPPAEAGEYLFDDEVGIPSNCHIAGTGMGSTVIKVADGADITPLITKDGAATTGLENITISNLTVDGNRANQTNGVYNHGIAIYRTANAMVSNVEVKDSTKVGLYMDGRRTGVTPNMPVGPFFVSNVYSHGNISSGIQLSDGYRRGTVVGVVCEENEATGAFLDASEMNVTTLIARGNWNYGIRIRNVTGTNYVGLFAEENRKHGIYITGWVHSVGSSWLSLHNGTATANTYDDVHFDAAEEGGYGDTSDVTIDGLVCGPNLNQNWNEYGGAFYGPLNPRTRYALYFTDENNVRISIRGRITTGSLTGDVRLPTDLNTLTLELAQYGSSTSQYHAGILHPSTGLRTMTKAGTPTDADFETGVGDGMIVADTSANKIWVRVGGTWKSVAVA